jgi:hypothetical protein
MELPVWYTTGGRRAYLKFWTVRCINNVRMFELLSDATSYATEEN